MVNLQPILENDLVLVRPLKLEDFEKLYQVANDPLIWELHQNPDRHELPVFKQFFKDAIASRGAFVIIEKTTNTIIGSSRFKLAANTIDAVEVGWTFLSRDFWGGTYNKSFKTLMINHAFKYFDYVIFHVDQNNFRSQKAVQKLGGKLVAKNGQLSHLHTATETGLTFVLIKEGIA